LVSCCALQAFYFAIPFGTYLATHLVVPWPPIWYLEGHLLDLGVTWSLAVPHELAVLSSLWFAQPPLVCLTAPPLVCATAFGLCNRLNPGLRNRPWFAQPPHPWFAEPPWLAQLPHLVCEVAPCGLRNRPAAGLHNRPWFAQPPHPWFAQPPLVCATAPGLCHSDSNGQSHGPGNLDRLLRSQATLTLATIPCESHGHVSVTVMGHRTYPVIRHSVITFGHGHVPSSVIV
jgi:hypothetical protein